MLAKSKLKSEKVAQEKDKAVAEMEIEPVVNKNHDNDHCRPSQNAIDAMERVYGKGACNAWNDK